MPENPAFSKKKGLHRIWSVFLTQKPALPENYGPGKSLRGAKVVQGGPKYLQGPPPLSAPMHIAVQR